MTAIWIHIYHSPQPCFHYIKWNMMDEDQMYLLNLLSSLKKWFLVYWQKIENDKNFSQQTDVRLMSPAPPWYSCICNNTPVTGDKINILRVFPSQNSQRMTEWQLLTNQSRGRFVPNQSEARDCHRVIHVRSPSHGTPSCYHFPVKTVIDILIPAQLINIWE